MVLCGNAISLAVDTEAVFGVYRSGVILSIEPVNYRKHNVFQTNIYLLLLIFILIVNKSAHYYVLLLFTSVKISTKI